MATATKKRSTQTPADLQISIEEVTPDIAQAWLELNTQNRKIRWTKVRQYARDITSEAWKLTGESIKFDSLGNLVDGQHRLQAVIQAGQPMTSLVVRGISVESQDAMDTGISRLLADQMSIKGMKNAPLLAAAGRWALIYDSGMMKGDAKRIGGLTHTEIYTFIDNAGELLTGAVGKVANSYRRTIDMPPSAVAACMYLLSRIDAVDAETFFERLSDGISLTSGSPILALRNRLRSIKNDRTRLSPGQFMALTLRAWNAWREGKKISSIQLMKDGATIVPTALV